NEIKSKQFIEKGLALQPKNADLHYALGLWYVRQKDPAKANTELKKAFTIDPSNASVVYGYALAMFSGGNTKEAVQILENYTSRYGNNATILDGIISICQDINLTEKANRYLSLRKEVFGY
ncbi:MAG: tetratricopeptide repeat protein, partial [Flavisolibacter sp.]